MSFDFYAGCVIVTAAVSIAGYFIVKSIEWSAVTISNAIANAATVMADAFESYDDDGDDDGEPITFEHREQYDHAKRMFSKPWIAPNRKAS